MPRKSNLISLSLNCGSQQQNNVFIIKDERVTAQLSFGGKTDPATGPGCLSLATMDTPDRWAWNERQAKPEPGAGTLTQQNHNGG